MAANSKDLSHLLPYLSEGFCNRCTTLLETRILNLKNNNKVEEELLPHDDHNCQGSEGDSSSFWTPEKMSSGSSLSSSKSVSPPSVTNQVPANEFGKLSVSGGNDKAQSDEQIRMLKVGRKKDFVSIEKVDGKPINVLQGLELHTRVFNEEEQKKIVDGVYALQKMGQSGKLRERTYSEPRKWMRGKGRVTIQFGCCYNYAVDKHGNPPGIIRDEEVDPMPPLLKSMIKRLVRWHVLPPSCIPNSCIINIYDEGDCIPPHIDHHDFLRPFCTVSFLTESSIVFGSSLKIIAPGEFSGSASISLPVGSVLVLKGNGADVAKHCVPAVHGKRISITFRKMDVSKMPFNFTPDPELQGIQPLGSPQVNKLPIQQVPNHSPNLQRQNFHPHGEVEVVKKSNSPIGFGANDFPPLGAPIAGRRSGAKK